MRVLRTIFAVLFALAWVVSTNSCLIASVVAPELEECCDGDSSDERPAGQPCGANDCGQCLTLESGVHHAALVPITLPPSVWAEDVLLSIRLREQLALTPETLRERAWVPPNPSPPPLHCESVKTGLPTRGPSVLL